MVQREMTMMDWEKLAMMMYELGYEEGTTKGANLTAQLMKMSPTKDLTDIILEIKEAQEYRIRHKELRLQMDLPLEVSAMPKDVRNELRYCNKTGACGPILPLMSLATDRPVLVEELSPKPILRCPPHNMDSAGNQNADNSRDKTSLRTPRDKTSRRQIGWHSRGFNGGKLAGNTRRPGDACQERRAGTSVSQYDILGKETLPPICRDMRIVNMNRPESGTDNREVWSVPSRVLEYNTERQTLDTRRAWSSGQDKLPQNIMQVDRECEAHTYWAGPPEGWNNQPENRSTPLEENSEQTTAQIVERVIRKLRWQEMG